MRVGQNYFKTGRENDFLDTMAKPRVIFETTALVISQAGLPTGNDVKLDFEIKNRDQVPQQIQIQVLPIVNFDATGEKASIFFYSLCLLACLEFLLTSF